MGMTQDDYGEECQKEKPECYNFYGQYEFFEQFFLTFKTDIIFDRDWDNQIEFHVPHSYNTVSYCCLWYFFIFGEI